MIKCEKGNVSINGAGNEVIHDLSETYLVPTVPFPKRSERKKQNR